MKKLLLLGLAVMLFTACKNQEEKVETPAAPMDSEAMVTTLEFDNAEASLQLVQNYVQALQKGDVNNMNAQLDEKVVILGLGGSLDSLNMTQHTEYFTESTSQYTHTISRDLYLPVKVENNWNEGEWVLTWGTNTITNNETNKSFDISYHIANKVENGKIVYMRYFYDMLNVIRNQGFTITPPAEAN